MCAGRDASQHQVQLAGPQTLEARGIAAEREQDVSIGDGDVVDDADVRHREANLARHPPLSIERVHVDVAAGRPGRLVTEGDRLPVTGSTFGCAVNVRLRTCPPKSQRPSVSSVSGCSS